ncbi:MAG: prolipoprotein diacylglyceryl transferase [Acidobacteria bacterium]|nr:prolipoprotein diacylglyceryl transferase [Acidobacteriota bacterium]
MHPLLAELGPISVYTYGVLLAAAYLAGLQLALVRARARGLDATRVMDLGIYVIIAALVGAKLLLLVVDFEYFSQHPGELFSLFRSGGVFYGGLILAVAVAFWHMRRHRLPLWTTSDVFAPGIALGHVIGRLGCFFAGCCYGRPTDVAWAVTFTSPLAAANVGTPLGVPLHPVQLYEAGAELVILGLLLWLERKGRPFPGRTFWGYVLVYSITRYVLEIYRGDPRGEVFNLMSTSQFISVLLVPVAIVMLVRLSRRPADAATEEKVRQAKKAGRRG